MKPIIEHLSEYFERCPPIAEGVLRADYLGSAENDFTLESVPCDPIIKRYVDGSTVRQYLFIIGTRQAYGEDTLQNIANSGLCEEIFAWIEGMNAAHELPTLPEGMTAQKIEGISNAYLLDENAQSFAARYQIQCRLTYLQANNIISITEG